MYDKDKIITNTLVINNSNNAMITIAKGLAILNVFNILKPF